MKKKIYMVLSRREILAMLEKTTYLHGNKRDKTQNSNAAVFLGEVDLSGEFNAIDEPERAQANFREEFSA